MMLTQAQVSAQPFISVPPGETIDLGTTTLTIGGGIKRFVKGSGSGPDPLIKFRGGDQSAPLSVVRGSILLIEGFRFDINPGAYMFFVRGGVQAKRCTAVNGGGLVGLRSADKDCVLEDCHTPLAGYYGVLTGAEAPQKDAAGNYVLVNGVPIVLLNKLLQLINCTANGRDQNPAAPDATFTHQHVLRFHALASLLISGGKYTGPQGVGHCATCRVHDVASATLEGVRIEGKTYFGPLAGGDGGMNLPPGPERTAAERARCNVAISHTAIVGDTIIGSGATVRISDSDIRDTSGTVVINAEADYIGRGEPVVDIIRTALWTKQPQGAVPWTAGRKRIRCGAGCTLNGAPLTADQNVK